MPEFTARPAYQIARGLEVRGTDAWFVVLRPAENPEAALQDFQDELLVYLNAPVRIIDATSASVTDLRQQLRTPPDDAVVLVGLDGWNQDTWTALDINRDGMVRRGALIFWLSPAGVLGLCQYAPNIRSFVGGSIFELRPDEGVMSEGERQRRIEALADHYQLGSEQVIQMAQAGTLPPEPEFVEWLILLGRGDLI